jgi:dTDP-glucose pyrophosphorylase
MIDYQKSFLFLPATIKDVMSHLDKKAIGIVLVVDEHHRLLGTITDGDVRRAILRDKSLDSSADVIMNKSPKIVREGIENDEAIRIMADIKVEHLPVVDAEGKVVDLKILHHIVQPERKENWVLLMAGGLGTRLYPLTENTPKPLLKVGGKPLLEIILEGFVRQGFYKFYISVNYKAEMIEEYFGDGSKWGVNIRYLRENKRMGTAGALTLINEPASLPMIVMNGDLLTKVNFNQLLHFHDQHDSVATMCVRDYQYQLPYGVVNIERNRLLSLEEKPIKHYFVNAGIYVINQQVMDMIPRDTFFDMTSLFEMVLEDRLEAGVYPIREYWIDIGRIDDFNRANVEYLDVFG